jgi:hypothetical protein
MYFRVFSTVASLSSSAVYFMLLLFIQGYLNDHSSMFWGAVPVVVCRAISQGMDVDVMGLGFVRDAFSWTRSFHWPRTW